MAKHLAEHDDLDDDSDVVTQPRRRGRHHEETSQFLCENCGYIGTAERVEDCPNCGYRMLALDEFGSFDDELGHGDDGDDIAARPAGTASFEDLKEDEFDDDKFDDDN